MKPPNNKKPPGAPNTMPSLKVEKKSRHRRRKRKKRSLKTWSLLNTIREKRKSLRSSTLLPVLNTNSVFLDGSQVMFILQKIGIAHTDVLMLVVDRTRPYWARHCWGFKLLLASFISIRDIMRRRCYHL